MQCGKTCQAAEETVRLASTQSEGSGPLRLDPVRGMTLLETP